MSIFTTTKNTFETEQSGERTIFVTRKHWFNLFVSLSFLFMLALAPFAFAFFLRVSGWYDAFFPLFRAVALMYYLILWNFLFYRLMLYSLNTIIVTNKRVVENQQNGLYRHTLNEVELANIRDISVKVFGVDATFLGFGDIEIQSAGAKNKFLFTQFPRPKNIKEIIMGAKLQTPLARGGL